MPGSLTRNGTGLNVTGVTGGSVARASNCGFDPFLVSVPWASFE
jgi:hypothetical protein